MGKFIMDCIQIYLVIKVISVFFRVLNKIVFNKTKKNKKNSLLNKLGILISLKLHKQIDMKILSEKKKKPVVAKQQANNVIPMKQYR